VKVAEHAQPSSRRPHLRLPNTREVETTLLIALSAALFSAALWYSLRFAARNDAVPAASPAPEVRLELILSGALSGSLNLGAAELKTVQCSASGFQLASTREAAYPLRLSFRGAPGRAESYAYYALGSGGDFKLKVGGTPYTLLSGTVTASPGERTFNASLLDAQSQPLQLSGRLTCP
jgi:hypothetical protein